MKLLHVTFHPGTTLEVEYAFKKLGHDVTRITFDDGETKDDQIYYIHYYRAENFWHKHKEYIDQFDGVITSDTCPISRAFLQNEYKKLLIIWICNRFDYYMPPEDLDGHYYHLLRLSRDKKNVFIVGNALLEIYHIASKNIHINHHIIRPIGKNFTPTDLKKDYNEVTPLSDKFFVPGYYNETVFMKLSDTLSTIGIPHENRRFEDHRELSQFKAVITLPYAWSTIAFFERIQLGMVQFIPSLSFLKALRRSGNYLFQPPFDENNFELLELSEWYCEENKNLMVFFDSWKDLYDKTLSTDYVAMSKEILEYADRIEKQSMQSWKNLFLMYKHLNPELQPKKSECKTITIGPSQTNTKIIPFQTKVCPPKLTIFNLCKDTFSYRFKDNFLFVTRTDENSGWAQNLHAEYVEDNREMVLLIRSYNRPEYLKKTLDSLLQSDIHLCKNIYIYDDASDDPQTILLLDSNTYMKNEKKHIEVIKSETNKGCKQSYIEALKLIKEKHAMDDIFVCTIDNDVEVKPNLIHTLLSESIDIQTRIDSNDFILTGFNCSNNHTSLVSDNRIGTNIVRKRMIGAVNYVIHISFIDFIVNKWSEGDCDWNVGFEMGKQNKPIYCLKKSVVNHVGVIGLNSTDINVYDHDAHF